MSQDNTTGVTGMSWSKRLMSSHMHLGIGFAGLVFLICFSGTLSVFRSELQRWEQPDAAQVTHWSSRILNQGISHIIESKEGRDSDINISFPSDLMPRLIISSGRRDESWIIDPGGRLSGKVSSPFSDFLVGLHRNLRLPSIFGTVLVGIIGVALLASMVSGIFAHPRIFQDAFRLRLGGAKVMQESDFHNRIGLWGLPFHFTIALTGAILGLSLLIFSAISLTLFKGDIKRASSALLPAISISLDKQKGSPAPLLDLDSVMTKVREALPRAAPSRLVYRQPGYSNQSLIVVAGSASRLTDVWYSFDARGRILPVNPPPIALNVVNFTFALAAVHFGSFGGLSVQLVYGILGASLTYMSWNGIAIWLSKRRARGAPSVVLEAFWKGFGWSQPVAYAVTAITCLYEPQWATLCWLAASLLSCIAFIRYPILGTPIMQAMSSALLLALSIIYIVRNHSIVPDPVAKVVACIIVVTALSLGVFSWRNLAIWVVLKDKVPSSRPKSPHI